MPFSGLTSIYPFLDLSQSSPALVAPTAPGVTQSNSVWCWTSLVLAQNQGYEADFPGPSPEVTTFWISAPPPRVSFYSAENMALIKLPSSESLHCHSTLLWIDPTHRISSRLWMLSGYHRKCSVHFSTTIAILIGPWREFRKIDIPSGLRWNDKKLIRAHRPMSNSTLASRGGN